MYILQLLRDLGHNITCPLPFLIDCSAATELSKKLGATKRTEHFLHWLHHFMRFTLNKYGFTHGIKDPEMWSDFMTKAVNPAKFTLCHKGYSGKAD